MEKAKTLFRFEIFVVERGIDVFSDNIGTSVITVTDLVIKEYIYFGLEADAA